MTIKQITKTSQRHASQFTEGTIVFSIEYGFEQTIYVIVKRLLDGHQTFAIFRNGQYVTASTNYSKAIGEAMLLMSEC
jgi:hypothetical protein